MRETTSAGVADGAILATDCAAMCQKPRMSRRSPAPPAVASASNGMGSAFDVGCDLVCHGFAGLDRAVHEAAELERALLAAEMHVALAHGFDADERRAVADAPVRVRAVMPAIFGPIVEECFAVPQLRDPRINRLELTEKAVHVLG